MMDSEARDSTIQNGIRVCCCGNGSGMFMENRLTIKVGSMIQIERIVSILMRMLRLLLMIDARASMRLERTCD